MKRRQLIKNSLMAAGLVGVSPLAGLLTETGSSKIGVMINLFKNTGCEPTDLREVTKYTNYKTAYQDLQAGKIDLLVSSTHFLLGDHEQFSLFGSFPEHYLANEDKVAWIQQNYHHVTSMHEKNGIASEYLGSLSPLLVRFSRVSFEDLANWKNQSSKLKIATSGVRSTWFDHIGFEAHSESFRSLTDKQLVDLHSGRLHVTDAISPALFLNAMIFLKSIENDEKWELKQIIEQAKSNRDNLPTAQDFKSFGEFNIIRDRNSKGSLPLEILYRKENRVVSGGDLKKIKSELSHFIENDKRYQKIVLEIFVEQFKIKYHDNLPVTLANAIQKCTDAYLNALSEHGSPLAAQLAGSYRTKES